MPVRAEARAIRETLRSNIARPWPLEQLSALVHLSKKQLTRVFAQAYGKTPHAYLIMLRVEEMARLLRESNQTITTIGKRVGWRSRSRAIDAFREYVGMSPSEYRTRHARIAKPALSSRQPTGNATVEAEK